MVLTGEIAKDGTLFVTHLEALGIDAQGRSRAAACAALVATLKELAAPYGSVAGWKVEVADDGEATLQVTSNEDTRMISLLLRRQRELNALSLADVANALGLKSRNAWAQYEHGGKEPSLGKLQELLAAAGGEFVVAVIPRTAQVLPRHEEDADDTAEIDAMLENPSPPATFRR
jgi:transcriptional regulator with XRE-family HTH domain